MTVLENIILAPMEVQKRKKEEVTAEARKLLKRIGLEDKENARPGELSGGQKQRVFIARALAQDAQLYIMDEPLAGVDETTERIIMDKFVDLQRENRTVIAVHHDLSTLNVYFDYLVVLNRTVKASDYLENLDKEAALARAYRMRE